MKKHSVFLILLIVGTVLFDLYQLFSLRIPQFSPKDELQKEAVSIYKTCLKTNRETCYASEFGDFTKTHDILVSIDVLKKLQAIDPVAQGCHLIAHSISIAEVAKHPDKWEEVLSKVTPALCTGGFIHGVVEAHTRYDSYFEFSPTTAASICSIVQKKTGEGQDLSCAHIIGHIALAEKLDNIPNAVDFCGKLDERLRYECYSGVFMENETRDNLVAHGLAKYVNWTRDFEKKQESICSNYTGVAETACWRELVHVFSFIDSDNPVLVYNDCQSAPTESAKIQCYTHGVGVMGSSFRFDEVNLALLCSPLETDTSTYKGCVDQVVGALLSDSALFANRVLKFCDAVNEDYQKECKQDFQRNISMLVPSSQRNNFCQSVDKQHRDICEGKS